MLQLSAITACVSRVDAASRRTKPLRLSGIAKQRSRATRLRRTISVTCLQEVRDGLCFILFVVSAANWSYIFFFFDTGRPGIPRDLKRASELFQTAADQGHAVAQFSIALMLTTGQVLQKVRAEASFALGLTSNVKGREICRSVATEVCRAGAS